MRPNVPAAVLHKQEPDVPPMAQQMGLSGTVHVVVSLDEQSHLTRVQIQSSPSAILNNAALSAARSSAFRTEIRDCKPIAASFILPVEFSGSEPSPHVDTSSPQLFVAYAAATIALPVNAIVLRFTFSTPGASASGAVIANDAAYEMFQRKLAALPAPLSPPSGEFYDVLPVGSPSQGFLASRGIAMTVARETSLRDLLRAADASGATSASIAYAVDKRPGDVASGVAAALRAAQRDARAVADRGGLRLGALFDAKTEVGGFSWPVPVQLGAPLARGELPAVPAKVDVSVAVIARFAIRR
jgi:TonB family protein